MTEYEVDPELVFVKWAYKQELLDADDLHALHTRGRAEGHVGGYLERLIAWGYLSADEVEALLDPDVIQAGLDDGLIDGRNAESLRSLRG